MLIHVIIDVDVGTIWHIFPDYLMNTSNNQIAIIITFTHKAPTNARIYMYIASMTKDVIDI